MVLLNLKVAPGLPWINANQSEIQQIIMNLVINGAEAIGPEGGNLRVSTGSAALNSGAEGSGEGVYFEVRDSGCGMDEATQRKIFDPFFTTKFTGRGLGLAAVLGIVKGHRGDIEVESHPGRGTTFRVYLPAHEPGELSLARKKAAVGANQTGKTILVVDDEDFVRRVAVSALESRGLRVIEAVNGLEALEKLQLNSRISVVILDLTMPVMTGEQALPLIRQIAPDVPVLLSSGFSHAEIQRRFEAAGIAGVLQKPYTVASIVEAVMNALNSAPVRD
jgi:CheY-like chemotaxis protein